MFGRRIATALIAALLASSLMAAPAQALGSFWCETGSFHPVGDWYGLSGTRCGGTGATDAEVHLRTGPSAGDYLCEFVFFWVVTGNLGGSRCVPL